LAQNDGEPPTFFAFGDRENHDLDKVAQKFGFEEELGPVKLNQALMVEYARPDRYWRAIYYNYPLFKSQYDSCVNRLLKISAQGSEATSYSTTIQSSDDIQLREPSDEIKDQVKARDGGRCLCCGEMQTRLLQIDHVAPSYYGGNNELDNLQTLCRVCNQTKGVREVNFRIHKTIFSVPPGKFQALELPKGAVDSEEWEKFIRRTINLFYGCNVVDYVTIGKRGRYFYEWYVYLYSGNIPSTTLSKR